MPTCVWQDSFTRSASDTMADAFRYTISELLCCAADGWLMLIGCDCTISVYHLILEIWRSVCSSPWSIFRKFVSLILCALAVLSLSESECMCMACLVKRSLESWGFLLLTWQRSLAIMEYYGVLFIGFSVDSKFKWSCFDSFLLVWCYSCACQLTSFC